MMREFYKGKKILITGNTGFKGAWLCRILHNLGANVYGYSLEPPTEPNLYTILKLNEYTETDIADVVDYENLVKFYKRVNPEIVFHLAAQPLVREGYKNPRKTYITNVIGTVNILECIRLFGAKSFVNITTDKVYRNAETNCLFSENDVLDGYDPYSNSKSCSELVTNAYIRSFPDISCPISTVRAGNVIGGGDFTPERIVPDCVRAAISGNDVILRNPNSVRPYQHVLEPLYAYLMIAWKQSLDKKYAGNYNIGPEESDCITTRQLADMFCKKWNDDMKWVATDEGGPHEANYLRLNNSKLKERFGISPLLSIDESIQMVIEWTTAWQNSNAIECIDDQISKYFSRRGIDV